MKEFLFNDVLNFNLDQGLRVSKEILLRMASSEFCRSAHIVES
jgi:hypothetical protein